MDFFAKLFDTSDFPARWHCGRWTDAHGWLHILSDIGVWSAYFAIPGVLLYFILRRSDLPFRKVFYLFGAFILLCGATHLMEAIIFWWPAYRLAGVLKLSTALVSWVTVLALVRVAPAAIAMRSPEELEREIANREKAEAELERANSELERRVEERTAELNAANAELAAERGWLNTTLTSIGDAVITTDNDGRVKTLNRVAEELTGWTSEGAAGMPLDEVFRIVNAASRQPVENPAMRALREGVIVGLANHTVLIDKEGTEYFIDDSAAPIHADSGEIFGAVLIFRDISARYESEQAFRHQYELTRAITDNATTAIFMLDDESRCTFANPAAEAMTGFSFAELENQNLHEVIHHTKPDGSPFPRQDCLLERALPEKHDVINHEDLFFRKNGESFPVMYNARPVVDGERAVGTVIEVLDLTQQKVAAEKLRESESRFQQLADAIPQLAWMAYPNGHIDWYNSRWYEYTGTTFEQMEGWGWKSVHDPVTLPQVIEQWQGSLASGEPFDMVFPLRGADGQFRPFLTRIMPFRDEEGNIVRWFGTNTDISEQRQVQEELRDVAARLSEADRRKDEFLATLAHELRNPLAPIRTALEVMKQGGDDPQTVELARSTMERQTQQLITLVDDLLDMSRITRGKLNLRKCPVELAEVMQTAVEASMPLIQEGDHELTVSMPDESFQLNADPNRLAQIISNLLNNAAKYTPHGGRISLKAEKQGQEALIAVKDDGIGIPEDVQGEIFDMFAQIDHHEEQPSAGLGIGLTIVKSLVDMHGGTIEVESAGVNEGSEFQVRLPLAVESQPEAVELSQPAVTVRKSGHRVLVVDDNTSAANMLSMLIDMQGHEVRTACDGREAVDIAADFLPDVVLMDIGMPNMNGYEAARFIRQQPWGKRMMMVALTGWGQEDDKQRTREAGFDHHLVKPAEPNAIEELLAQVDSKGEA